MKKLLNKKWRSIPIGILVAVMALVLVTGSVFAAYSFLTVPTEITVEEPMIVTLDYDCTDSWVVIDGTMPFTDWGVAGDTRTFALRVENRANSPITVAASIDGTYANTQWFTFTGLPSGSIGAEATWSGYVTVKIANDTPPSTSPYAFNIVFERS